MNILVKKFSRKQKRDRGISRINPYVVLAHYKQETIDGFSLYLAAIISRFFFGLEDLFPRIFFSEEIYSRDSRYYFLAFVTRVIFNHRDFFPSSSPRLAENTTLIFNRYSLYLILKNKIQVSNLQYRPLKISFFLHVT